MTNISTEEVVEMIKQGKRVSDIAKQCRVTRQAIYCHINKLKKKNKPKYTYPRKNYNSIIDWKVYNEGLVKRGEILLDFDFFNNWREELRNMNEGKKGRPYQYPEVFILFLLKLKCIFKIDYRTLEGIARRFIVFIVSAGQAPDYTTLQIRLKNSKYELDVYSVKKGQELAGDSSGLKTSNRGEYRMNKYRGERKKYVKLHIVVDIKTGEVVGFSLTPEETRDHKELPNLISQAKKRGKITRILLDRGYDNQYTYKDLIGEGIKPIIKPKKSMGLEKVRDALKGIELKKETGEVNIGRYKRLITLKEYLQDKEGWKERNGYGQRWKVEVRYSVFKRIFGEHIFSKVLGNMKKEAILKVNLMNLFGSLTRDAFMKGEVSPYKEKRLVSA